MPCNHKFQGDKDGVRCLLCGLRMTPKEYAEYLRPSATEEPENIQNTPDEPEAPAGEPQAESKPKKPRTSRKKKEATANG